MLWLVLGRRRATRAFYDAYAADYDVLVRGQPDALDARQFVTEYLSEHGATAGSVLEAGCGTGLYSRQLRGLCDDLHGVDFSVEQLRQARRRGVSMSHVLGDVIALPYRGGSFDTVASLELLGHLPIRAGEYFAEAYRVLKPGGLFFLDPLRRVQEPHGPAALLLQWMRRSLRRGLIRVSNIDTWLEPPTPDLVATALAGAGFEVERYARSYARDWWFLVGKKLAEESGEAPSRTPGCAP